MKLSLDERPLAMHMGHAVWAGWCTALLGSAWAQDVSLPNSPAMSCRMPEAGVTAGWWKYGCKAVIGLDRFGESAPAGELFKLFGFTADNPALTVRKVLRK